MRKRKLALAMAAVMMLTSVPANSLTGLAEEVIIAESTGEEETAAETLTAEVVPEQAAAGTVISESAAKAENSGAAETVAEDVEETEAVPDENASQISTEPETVAVQEDACIEVQEQTEAAEELTENMADTADAEADGDAALVTETEAGQTEAVEEAVTEAALDFVDGEFIEEAEEIVVEEAVLNAGEDGSSMATAIPITLGSVAEVSLTSEIPKIYYKITPSVTRTYTFYSRYNSGDPFAVLTNADGEEIVNNDDGGEEFNFRIQMELQAGSTYYLVVDDRNGSGSYEVVFSGLVIDYDTMDTSLVVDYGSMVTLSVSASGLSDELSYQWYEEANPLLDETTNQLTITDVRKSGQYTCIVTDGDINETITFSVRVESGLVIENPNNPITADFGTTQRLEVTATSDYPDQLIYQWQSSDIGTDVWVDMKGEVQPSCSVVVGGDIWYRCIVSDRINTEHAFFEITADSGLEVQYDDSERNIVPGGSTVLSVNASTRLGTLSYQWYYDGELVAGAVSDSYTVTRIGYYECRVTNGYESSWAYFNVFFDTGLDVGNTSKTVVVAPGGSATLTVNAVTNYGPLTYQWYDENNEEIAGGTSASFTTPAIYEDGYYYCQVSDAYNSRWVDFNLRVRAAADSGVIYGNTANVNITVPRTWARYAYTPGVSGTYIFRAVSGGLDTYGVLTDANGNTIISNDDGEDTDYDFEIAVNLKAGVTYYLLAGFYSSDGTGSYTVNIQMSHAHQYVTEVSRVNSTCVAPGAVTRRCSCGDTDVQALPLAAHTFGAWSVSQAPTALAEGAEVRTCSVCQQAETRAVAKLAPTMTLNASKITLQLKQSTTKIKVTGLAEGDYVKSWTSSNTKVVKVNQKGKITAAKKLKSGKKSQKATITVTLASGLTKTIKVTVQKKAVATKSIKGVDKKVTLKKKQKLTLKPVLAPITSQDKVKYSTSNKKVATVSKKGVIQAKGKGKATITVKAGKKTVRCKVTVK